MTDADEEPGPARRPAEHPVDAAARGAHHGPPTPRQPSTRFTWSVRAALVLPLGVATLAAVEVLARPLAARQLIQFVAAVLVLLSVAAMVWWSAGRPRLDFADQSRLGSQLSRDGRRRLHRALRRGQPIPTALQPYAHPYVVSAETGSLFGFVGASIGLSSMLLNLARLREATGFDAVVLALTAAMGIGLVAFAVVTRRMRKHLCQQHESGQPERPTPGTDAP